MILVKLTSQTEPETFRNTKRETPAKEKSVENRQVILVCDRIDNLVVTGHVQHIQKQTVFSSDVRKHEEIKCHTCPNSVQRLSEAAGTGEVLSVVHRQCTEP